MAVSHLSCMLTARSRAAVKTTNPDGCTCHYHVVLDDQKAFERLIEPTRASLRELALRGRDVRVRRGVLPAADARAMRELEESEGLDNDRGNPMARDAWSLAGVLLFAAEDHILAMCSLLEWSSMPVYAHTVLARAALEASLWAAWLSDLEVDVRRCVGRT
jgi:hypothetical protein